MSIDMVFDPEGTNPEETGLHQHRQMKTAPTAWDHLEQPAPIPVSNHKRYNALTTPPNEAMSTITRSVNHHTLSAIPISGTLTSTQGPAELVPSQKGRQFVIVKCPPANSKGVFISEQKDALVAVVPLAYLVSPTDAPLFIPTEDALWFIAQSGAVATDVVQLIVGWYRPDEY